jgi:tRNA threonylcarbamoyladenosine biosynthesis protein TsaE
MALEATASGAAPAPATATLISRSDRETHRIGERLGALCEPGDLVLLEGDLGTGKTTLAQGMGRGLGISATINSPTFTLVKEYTGRLPLYHFDLYRLDDPGDVVDLGIDDYLEGDGVCVVEWAERAAAVWPPSFLRVRLTELGPHSRRVDLEGLGPRGRTLCIALAGAISSVNDPGGVSPGEEQKK